MKPRARDLSYQCSVTELHMTIGQPSALRVISMLKGWWLSDGHSSVGSISGDYCFSFVILCFVSLYTAGETLDLGLQEWCYNVVGRNQCLLLDIWWQTGKKIV